MRLAAEDLRKETSMVSHPRRSRLVLASAAFILLFGLAASASAQGGPGFHLGISGGVDIPIEDQEDVYNVGWNGTLMLVWNFGTSPFGIRFDGSYGELTVKDELVLFNDGKARFIDGTANFVIGPHFGFVQPYILGGVGAYDLKFSGEDLDLDELFSESSTRFGWNAGIGIAFRMGDSTNTHFFVEGRYTSIDLDADRFTDSLNLEGRRFTMIMVNTGIVF
jgi:opacity protein-like surface antigen